MEEHLYVLFLILTLGLQNQVSALDCPKPEIAEFSTITPDSAVYKSGSTVTYKCTNGQVPREGNTTRQCNNDGSWSGVVPHCVVIPDPPTNVRIEHRTSWGNFVWVYWTGPINTEHITGYQTICYNNNNTLQSRASRSPDNVYGITPNTMIRCEVTSFTANDVVKSKAASSATVKLLCTAPSQPSLKVSSPTLVLEFGRKRWKYNITWEKPSEANCDGMHNPPFLIRYQPLDRSRLTTDATSRIVFADGGKEISFSVWAVNSNKSVSSDSTRTITTPIITASLGDCYRPEIPAYSTITPDMTVYQFGSNVTYRCTNGKAPVDGDTTRSCSTIDGRWSGVAPLCLMSDDIKECGTPPQAPYTKIPALLTRQPGVLTKQECADGYSEAGTASKNCLCQDSGRWDNFCQTSIQCLVIPDPPTNVRLERHPVYSHHLVVQWSHPKNTRNITNYKIRCYNSTQSLVTRDTSSTSYTYGGFSPYALARCEVSSVNGPSESNATSSGTLRFSCAAPSPPLNLKFLEPSTITDSGRIRWKYNVTWEQPAHVNCAGMHAFPYDVRYPNVTSPRSTVRSTNTVVVADGNQWISFTVWARNSNYSLSSPVTVTTTTPPITISTITTPMITTPTITTSTITTPTITTSTITTPTITTPTITTSIITEDVLTSSTRTECPKVISGIADPLTGTGQIRINMGMNMQVLTLPIGQYPYSFATVEGSNCSLVIIVYDDLVTRRLEFEATYNIKCDQLKNSVTKQMILTTAKHNYKHVQLLCKGVCNIADSLNPIISCSNDTLAIRWPTNTVYGADQLTIPEETRNLITKRSKQNFSVLPIVIISKLPPIVYPVTNKDGSSARIMLESQCSNGATYNAQRDTCGRG